MAVYKVTNINKPNRFDPYSRILGIGGFGWYMTEAQVMAKMATGDLFVVSRLGFPDAYVTIGHGPTGIPDLRTTADGIFGNNLLALPQYP